MDINLDFLSGVISELNFFFTNLARSEQIKDVDMRSKTSKRAIETDEDISSTFVHVYYKHGSVSLDVTTNDNNTDSIWKNNFFIMAKTLLPSKIDELISGYKNMIIEQIRPYIIESIGGALI